MINRGFSGYNTKHLRIILHELLEEFEPEDVCGFVLMLGSNDSTDPTNKIQHVSLEDYKKNMRWIIDYILNKWGLPKDKLILIKFLERLQSSIVTFFIKRIKCKHKLNNQLIIFSRAAEFV